MNKHSTLSGSQRRSASLKLVNLRKQFGEVVAIDDVSLDVSAGEFVTLLGASGSGKSTTLMAVAGFVEATSGEVLINGEGQSSQPPHKRDIGLVFQHYALFPHLSVEKNVAFPLEMRGLAKSQINERVRRALDLVKLGSLGARKPSEMSGGQQQRVALARALVYEPSILLLDEPLGALDKSLREEMQWEIRRIQQSLAITTVAVTHDQHEAITMSDRIAVMRNGRIEQFGTPADIYERPRSRYIAEFMGSSNFLRGTVEHGADGGRLRLGRDTAVPLAPSAGTSPGKSMDLVIRPERVRCTPTAENPDAIPGAITGITYVGEAWQISVKLDSGGLLTASHANDGELGFSPGDRVAIDLGKHPWWAVPLES
ncbi:ABC transporter ATP-binding protein [Caballeronia zhejiangensis]|jgi:spermidine/putrescine ABC transporter ATP-binding subunit|uniref:ABC transporter ATP-binding protein n=1 Tax=Caballeronia zhejiangensis TaxID=871203 RepID=UPI001FD12E2B|nr:ABC transporter ATP-binding protein [Caballeronia zhejiangensis]